MILESALLCLSLNIYHEARGESVPGQYAVAQVTMNRADGNPKRVCQEVYRPNQFSWTKKKVRYAKLDPDAWNRAQIIASVVLTTPLSLDLSNGATHYHATNVRPEWARSMKRTKVIGHHYFYA